MRLTDLVLKIGAALRAHDIMLASAESCTGGWIGQALTSVPGSSDWYDCGFITYSNAAKQALLGVTAETLARHGAVSRETAAEMARGALRNSRAGIGCAVTGIAGPGGGSPAKPVGSVCFGWARGETLVRARGVMLYGDREAVRRQSVCIALEGILEWLDEGGA
jgi:nicotinamide-nucleotide amidase